ncbi:N-acetylmuramoyl-L-alanine amidase [Cellulosimicrobium marinum]|uniref:N-acetylmuramoyl-L-alanine amidase n=1 Tax=Cellulosimicrobium marinum TaxID=1638992 RepID=UPI001E495672|nr:N-acetylmuramoyl-L-alanine amidase [Cellulosimicrobium marinum]
MPPDVRAVEIDDVVEEAVEDPTALEPAVVGGLDVEDAAQPEERPTRSGAAAESTGTPSGTGSPDGVDADESAEETDGDGTADPGEVTVDGAEGRVAGLTALTATEPFLVAGVTWDDEADSADVVEVAVRVLADGSWSDWTPLEVEDLGMAGERPGTAPVVTGGSEGIQARVVTESGDTPDGARIDLVDPGTSAADGRATGRPAASADAATGDELRPAIVTRAQWGADESRGSAWPDVSAQLKAMFVHHTAGTNSYSKAQAPAIVRGIYAYHTGSRDWPDIGYQFLVDKYGTIYQGRRDALQDLPVGAQVGGFNTETIGVSAMGNYETARPSSGLVTSIERVLAWQAFRHGLDATGSVTLTGGGSSSRYQPGSRVSVRVISGHRDTSYTTCPGQYLYAKLSSIRSNVKSRVASATTSYGPARPTTWAVQPGATPATLGPAQLPYTAAYEWSSVPGAVGYKVYQRNAPHGAASPDSRSWKTLRTVTGTRTSISTPAGYTRSVAVRPVDSAGRLGTLTQVRTSTRPIGLTSMTFSPSYAKVSDSAYLWDAAMRSTSSTAAVTVRGVRQARQVVIIGPTGPGKGRLQVVVGGRVVGTVSMASSTISKQGQRVVTLPGSTSGTVTIRSMDAGKDVRISALSFPRTEPAAATPGKPRVNQLSTAYSPISMGTSTPLRWAASPGAVRYDVYVRAASYRTGLPDSWTKLTSTTRTTHTARSATPGGLYVYGVRAVGRSGTSPLATFYSVARPLPSTDWELSTGSRAWTRVDSSRYVRGYVYRTEARGATLTVPDAVEVRRVRVIGKVGPGGGAVDVYVGGTRYGRIDLSASSTVDRRSVDLYLPRLVSGDVELRTVSTGVVRISAVALGHR